METIAEGHVIIELVRNNNFFMHFLNLSDISRFIDLFVAVIMLPSSVGWAAYCVALCLSVRPVIVYFILQ